MLNSNLMVLIFTTAIKQQQRI